MVTVRRHQQRKHRGKEYPGSTISFQQEQAPAFSLKAEPFLPSPGKDLMGQVLAGFPVGWKEGPELPEAC
jgi:hypothetical protein